MNVQPLETVAMATVMCQSEGTCRAASLPLRVSLEAVVTSLGAKIVEKQLYEGDLSVGGCLVGRD